MDQATDNPFAVSRPQWRFERMPGPRVTLMKSGRTFVVVFALEVAVSLALSWSQSLLMYVSVIVITFRGVSLIRRFNDDDDCASGRNRTALAINLARFAW